MDLTTLIADIQAALDEACRLAGIPTHAETLAAETAAKNAALAQVGTLTAANTQLTTDKAALQTRIDGALQDMAAADAGDAAEDAARGSAKQKLLGQ